jgi:hypothetical protein
VKLPAVEGRQFLQAVAGRAVNGIALGDVRKFDDRCRHYFRL